MSDKSKIGIEIERKYVIRMPDISILAEQEGYTSSSILQIYLPAPAGSTHRIRSRRYSSEISYTETKKRRIDHISSEEHEREITESEFASLATQILDGTHPVSKVRHTFLYRGALFELDVYPEWKQTAIMETELDSRDTALERPDFIEIVKEVTGDKSYSNRAMAQHFPAEQL